MSRTAVTMLDEGCGKGATGPCEDAAFHPNIQEREARLVRGPTSRGTFFPAILFVDCQNFNCSRMGALYRSKFDKHREEDVETKYFFSRLEKNAVPNWKLLLQACRSTQAVHVIFTVIQSLREDGADRSLDYKISGFHVPPNSFDAQVLQELGPPHKNEIVLPKSSSSVFMSTNLDYILRNLQVRQLIICGCLTDQCVEHAVRDACDLGYLVTLVDDSCATMSDSRHRSSLQNVSGYCRIRQTAEILQEIAELLPS